MLRMFVRWMISRSIDEDRPVPAWARRKIDGDEELTQFELRSRQLGARLKTEAAVWISTQSKPATELSLRAEDVLANKSLRRMMWFTGTGIAVSAATIAVVIALNRPEEVSRIKAGPLSGQQIVVAERTGAGDLEVVKVSEWLIQSANKSHATLEQLHSRAKTIPIRLEDIKLREIARIEEPAKFAGSTASQAYAILDRSLDVEQKRLASEMKSAFSFFTYRLPMSLARMAGQNPEG